MCVYRGTYKCMCIYGDQRTNSQYCSIDTVCVASDSLYLYLPRGFQIYITMPKWVFFLVHSFLFVWWVIIIVVVVIVIDVDYGASIPLAEVFPQSYNINH